MGIYIIAEIGVNHNGDVRLAERLIDAAAEAGCDAAKFQVFRARSIVTMGAERAEYQKKNMGSAKESQFDMLKKLELSEDDFRHLKDYCLKRGVDFLATPFDDPSIAVLEELGVPRYKIGSGDITNKPFLKRVAQTGKDVILSTGMSTIGEVEEAIEWLREEGAGDIALLHCTSAYPTEYDDVNMLAMKTMARHFDLPVGYSDHTIGSEIAVMAAALGATVIEKHVTLDCGMEGPDHAASLGTDDLPAFVASLRHVESAFGTGEKTRRPCEEGTAIAARKSLVAARNIVHGTVLSAEDIAVKRPGSGLAPKELEDVVGKTALRDIEEEEILSYESLGC